MSVDVQRRRSDVGTAMHKKSLVKRLSAPTITIAEVDGRMTQSCTIRFLDDSEPMSLHFKVRYLLQYRRSRVLQLARSTSTSGHGTYDSDTNADFNGLVNSCSQDREHEFATSQ